ncbi:MAG: FAD-binding protein [Polyangiales bacterium]
MTTRRDWLRNVTLGAIGATPGLAGCGWCNVVRTVCASPDSRPSPGSAAALVRLVKEAERRHTRIRMTGSGHSFSDVTTTQTGFLLGPKSLDERLTIDRSRLRDEGADSPRRDLSLVRTQSGRTIRQLNCDLDELGLAFANLGGYDAQTIVGAASTGTHGSGLRFGPITSQIVSWQVVTAHGEVWQIEPSSGGITDPAHFPAYLEEDTSIPVKLVQDDAFFDAIGVGIGCLGIVYAVVLKTVPKFWLREERTKTTWEALTEPTAGFMANLVAHGDANLPSDLQHYEVYFNPYSSKDGTHDALLTRRYHLLADAPGPHERPPAAGWDAVWSWLLTQSEATALTCGNEAFWQPLITKAVNDMACPNYTQVAHRVFHEGFINESKLYAVELAFPFTRTLDVMKRFLVLAERQARRYGRCNMGPVTLRFVAPSPAFIAPQQGCTTTMMEIGAPVHGCRQEALLRTYQAELIELDSSIRPHWGQDLKVLTSERDALRHWPETWGKWKAAYARMNESGVFNGDITDRLGMSL